MVLMRKLNVRGIGEQKSIYIVVPRPDQEIARFPKRFLQPLLLVRGQVRVSAQREVAGVDHAESAVILRTGIWSHHVVDKPAQKVPEDRYLLVPIGIQLHAPLLHENAAEILQRIEA